MITFERVNIGWWYLAERCIVQKSRPRSKLEVIALLGAHPQKCGVGQWCWKNQRRLSSWSMHFGLKLPHYLLSETTLWTWSFYIISFQMLMSCIHNPFPAATFQISAACCSIYLYLVCKFIDLFFHNFVSATQPTDVFEQKFFSWIQGHRSCCFIDTWIFRHFLSTEFVTADKSNSAGRRYYVRQRRNSDLGQRRRYQDHIWSDLSVVFRRQRCPLSACVDRGYRMRDMPAITLMHQIINGHPTKKLYTRHRNNKPAIGLFYCSSVNFQ